MDMISSRATQTCSRERWTAGEAGQPACQVAVAYSGGACLAVRTSFRPITVCLWRAEGYELCAKRGLRGSR